MCWRRVHEEVGHPVAAEVDDPVRFRPHHRQRKREACAIRNEKCLIIKEIWGKAASVEWTSPAPQ